MWWPIVIGIICCGWHNTQKHTYTQTHTHIQNKHTCKLIEGVPPHIRETKEGADVSDKQNNIQALVDAYILKASAAISQIPIQCVSKRGMHTYEQCFEKVGILTFSYLLIDLFKGDF